MLHQKAMTYNIQQVIIIIEKPRNDGKFTKSVDLFAEKDPWKDSHGYTMCSHLPLSVFEAVTFHQTIAAKKTMQRAIDEILFILALYFSN